MARIGRGYGRGRGHGRGHGGLPWPGRKVAAWAGAALMAAAAAAGAAPARAGTDCASTPTSVPYPADARACTTTGSGNGPLTESANGPGDNSLTYANQGTIDNSLSGSAAVNLFTSGTPMSETYKTFTYLTAPPITATNGGTITSSGSAGSGILAVSNGATGVNDQTVDDSTSAPNNHYMGRNGGAVQVTNAGTIVITSGKSGFQLGYGGLELPLNAGIDARSVGGAGTADATGNRANGPGGDAGGVTVDTAAGSTISLSGGYTAGIYALSVGGQGPGYSDKATHNFDSGGKGGAVTVDHAGSITGTADGTIGIYALSVGGESGATDSQYSLRGGDAGAVGVRLDGGSSVDVTGSQSQGVFAASVGGLSWYADNSNSSGHRNGDGGDVKVTVDAGARVSTSGELGVGIVAASTGGNANTALAPPDSLENGGSSNSVPTTRAPAGNAGDVTVSHDGAISTAGDVAIGIAAVSSTGGRAVSLPSGSGGGIDPVGTGSGSPGTVTVAGGGSVSTSGKGAIGILGLSVGGPGGVLDTRNGILNLLGGDDSVNNGIDGNAVQVTSTGKVATTGAAAIGILASSIGGGGGSAGGTKGILAVGSSGGGGGSGGQVTVQAAGDGLATGGDGAIGVLAQSIGGGGGNGGNASGVAAAAGSAGGGGGGGKVTVDLSSGALGSLATGGDFAAGVIAQSVGGGGGNGGYAKGFGTVASLAIGGTGGSGGAGGEVDLTNSGATVTTSGAHSTGLIAQSVGGGGGNGGSANTYSADVGFSIALAVGGTAGSGGAGGAVNLTNDYHIETGAEDALGMIAQSIGGGGGNGGAATAKSLLIGGDDPEVPSVVVDMAVGGKGGSGGAGGSVTVDNGGRTITRGDGAHALLAQSVGGGGGNGGDSTAGNLTIEGESETLKVSVALGASGGSGGNGGSVGVTNGSSSSCGGCASETHTYGNDAAGIVAQSIGGGGGNSTAGNASTDSPNLGGKTGDAINLGFSLGATGGTGGKGGLVGVTLKQNNPLTTAGSGAIGILAQSIGGGGGNAGGGSAGGSGDKVNLNVAIGGGGGTGNIAGKVTVESDGSIATQGGDSAGIVAQSIGGGGGIAGSADAAASISKPGQVEDQLNPPASSYSASVGVGGDGGTGGDGGSVSVDSAGSIRTAGARAYGILAQSIGGGGGSGGAATSAANSVLGGGGIDGEGAAVGKTYAATVSVGGKGSAAGAGGLVQITSAATITTQGYGAHGILAHSVGGGGGIGAEGSVNNTTTLGLGAGVAGGGGAGGTSAPTVVEQTGPGITTVGDDAYGIMAQSIGGGGGTAGAGCSNSIKGAGQTGLEATACFGKVGASASGSLFNDSSDFTLKIGGTSGASGNGEAVTINHDSGAIETWGARSFGIVAQSIGGGGGLAAAAAVNLGSTQLQLQPGQNYAKGGDVTVTLGGGASIATHGDGAWGILAQSIGGGGGFAGDPSLALQFPRSNTLPDKPNSSGRYPDSGKVTLALDGDITTTGARAHGVFAQAVGGGGGIAAGGNQSRSASVVAGNSAQLYGGLPAPTYAGEAMEVTIDQTGGAIRATGQGSIGIIAQASGKSNYQRPISITVGGAVQGGTGAGAAGILVSGGGSSNTDSTRLSNTITVNRGGSVGTVDGAEGLAITTADGLTNLVNNGTVTGSILLDNGTLAGGSEAGGSEAAAAAALQAVAPMAAAGRQWHRPSGPRLGRIQNRGTLVAGPRLAARKLFNTGILEVGGRGRVARTVLEGDLIQKTRGRLVLDVDYRGRRADRLVVRGDAVLAGLIQPNALSLRPGSLPVLTARRLDLSQARVKSDLVTDYKLETSGSGRTLRIRPLLHLAPKGVDLGATQGEAARHLQAAWDAGGAEALAPVFGALAGLATADELRDALDDVAPTSLTTDAIQQASAGRAALNATQSCPSFADPDTTGLVMLGEGSCVWARVTAAEENQDAQGDSLGYEVDRTGIRAGVQGEPLPDWFLGLSVGYADVSWNSDRDGASGDGDMVDVALALKKLIGRWQLGGAVDLGYGWYDDERRASVGGLSQRLESSPDVLTVTGRLRAAYEVGLGRSWYLKPYADLDLLYSRTPSYDESGGSLALEVEDQDHTSLAVSPMIELGGRLPLGGSWLVRPYVAAGATLPSDNSWSSRARLDAAPDAAGAVAVTERTPDVLA